MTLGRPGQGVERSGGGKLPAVTWRWREIGLSLLVLLGAYVAVSATVVAPAAVAFGEDSDWFRLVAASSTIIIDLALAAGVFYFVRQSGATPAQLGFRRPVEDGELTLSRAIWREGFPWGYTARLVVAALVAAFVTTTAYSELINAAGLDELLPHEQIEPAYFESAAVTVVLGIAVVAVAPVVEEVFFRGFLFPGIAAMAGFWPGAIVSSVFFSFLHFQVGLVIPFAIIGFILALLYYRSGSLIPSITTHFIFNAVSFMALVLFPEAR